MSLASKIEKLEQAARLARPGAVVITIVNDPEEGLEAYKIDNLDVTRTIEIGLASPDDYEAYASAAKANLAATEKRVTTVVLKPAPVMGRR